MIVANTEIVINKVKYLVRKCDICGEEKQVVAKNIISNKLKNKLDLCWTCAHKKRCLPNGKDHKTWKHGITKNGYKRINTGNKRVLEHVAIMEQKIGQSLKKGEIVHHIDLNKLNNDISNLWLFNNQTEHNLCHFSLRKCGFSLLNKKIWFNHELNTYQLEPYTKPIFNSVDCSFKLYKKTDKRCGITYLFYYKKNEEGKCQWHRHHIFVAEKILGRKLSKKEVVHHIDNNSINNDPSNLVVVTNSEHKMLHNSIEKLTLKCDVCFNSGLYMVK